MKKPIIVTLIALITLFGIYTLFGQLYLLKFFNNPSAANEPGIERNSITLASSLVNYKHGDFICYKYEDDFLGKHIRVHRLIGMPGDTIKLEKGNVYINNVNFDDNIPLKHSYTIDLNKYEELVNQGIFYEDDFPFMRNNEVTVFLSDAIAEQYNLSDKIRIESKDNVDQAIKKIYNNNWNKDNFGPLIIPAGKYFVIGDNRHNSLDSRYIGLIDKPEIVAAVILR